MIDKEECIKLILKKFPGFHKTWEEHLKWWGDDIPGFSNDVAVFSRYTKDLLTKEAENLNEIREIFDFVEILMQKGTDDVKDAAATCFLENLINASSGGSISSRSFVHLLGEESVKYCKAWDEFTQVKTEGLWDDEK